MTLSDKLAQLTAGAFLAVAITHEDLRGMVDDMIERDRRRVEATLAPGSLSITILGDDGRLGELVEGLDYCVDWAAGTVRMLDRDAIRGALSFRALSGAPLPSIASTGKRRAQWKTERRGRA
jgi:hypothetical protein